MLFGRYLLLLVLGLQALSLHAGDVSVSDVRWREPIPGQTVGALYFSLNNESSQPLILTGISLDWARKAEYHEHSHDNGMMRMRRVPQVEVAPGQTLHFEPGGLHIMVFGVAEGASSREALPLQLIADDGRQIQLDAKSGS
jgi:copper(I)-binding protein